MSDSPHPRSKYRHLFEDKDVGRWYENLVRGSPACAEIYLRNLGNFCQLMGITPGQLVRKPVAEIEDLLMDYVTSAQKEHAGSLRKKQEFLQTKEKEETSEEKLRDSFRKQLLLVAGFSQEEVEKMDLPSMSDEELKLK